MHCSCSHNRFVLYSVRTDSKCLRFYCSFSQRSGIRLVLVARSVSSPGDLGIFQTSLDVRPVAILGGGFDVVPAGTWDTPSAHLEGVKTYVTVYLRNTRAACRITSCHPGVGLIFTTFIVRIESYRSFWEMWQFYNLSEPIAHLSSVDSVRKPSKRVWRILSICHHLRSINIACRHPQTPVQNYSNIQ